LHSSFCSRVTFTSRRPYFSIASVSPRNHKFSCICRLILIEF
jgi:hypothetical protein